MKQRAHCNDSGCKECMILLDTESKYALLYVFVQQVATQMTDFKHVTSIQRQAKFIQRINEHTLCLETRFDDWSTIEFVWQNETFVCMCVCVNDGL